MSELQKLTQTTKYICKHYEYVKKLFDIIPQVKDYNLKAQTFLAFDLILYRSSPFVVSAGTVTVVCHSVLQHYRGMLKPRRWGTNSQPYLMLFCIIKQKWELEQPNCLQQQIAQNFHSNLNP